MSADQDVPTTYAEAAWERGAATAEEHGRPREEVTPAAESGGNDEAEDAERKSPARARDSVPKFEAHAPKNGTTHTNTGLTRAYGEKRAKKNWCVSEIEAVMANGIVQGSLTTMLFLSLYLPDVWTLVNPSNDADVGLNAVLFGCYGAFNLEMGLLYLARDEYRTSFFFAMDMLGTQSILLDVTMIARGTSRIGVSGNTNVLRAARLAKIGAKSGRLAKLVRVFRLLFSKHEKKEESDLKGADLVSAQLSKLLAQRVALLVMIMLMVTPFLQAPVTDLSVFSFVEILSSTAIRGIFETPEQWESLGDTMYRFYNSKQHFANIAYRQPLSLRVTDATGEQVLIDKDYRRDFGNVRSFNEMVVTPLQSQCCVRATFNIVKQTNEEATASILLICLVVFLLLGFAASFNHSVELLIVNPLKRIITSLRESTIAALRSIHATASLEDEGDGAAVNEDGETVLETDLLEIMVAKLARIVSKQTQRGNNKKFIDDMDVDSNTADWLHSFLPEDTNSPRPDVVPGAHMMRNLESRTSMLTLTTKETRHLNDWHLDPMELHPDDIINFVSFIFHEFNVLDKFHITDAQLHSFLVAISRSYKTEADGVPYHNWVHAFDVTHTLYRFIRLSRAFELYTSLEILSALVAVVAHDVGHPGVSNHFLVATRHPLATLHNDRSPLENMHCATLYSILRDDKVNVLRRLTEPQWRDARKHVISMILNTDMTHHFENVSKLQVFYELEGAELGAYWRAVAAQDSQLPERPAALNEVDKRMMILEILLHAADISNPVKPFAIYERWAEKVMEEFFRQGDRERALGLEVAPMYDRALADMPTAQLGFVEFIVSPLYLEILRFAPGLDQTIAHLLENHAEYTARAVAKLEAAERPESEKIAMLKAKPGRLRAKFEEKLGDTRVDPEMAAAAEAAADARRGAGGGGRRKSVTKVAVGGKKRASILQRAQSQRAWEPSP